MVTALLKSAFLGTGLGLLGFTGSAAHAQTLLDVVGAGAIQNTLQSLPAGGASGVIERSRGSVDQFSQTEQLRLEALQQLGGGGGGGGGRSAPAPSAALLGPLMGLFGAMGASGAAPGGSQTLTTAQVNGQLVPYCSHGGLCYGSLMRAVRRY